jgi:small subunit ribosomal protein S9
MESQASTVTETAEKPVSAGTSETDIPELTLGSGAPAEQSAESKTVPKVRGRIDRFGVAMGTGRRKTAVARVRISRGSGKLTINNRTLEDYFRVERNRALVEGPLAATDMLGKVDIWVRAQGGGTTGQVGAVVLGIARALQAMDPGLHGRLSEGGFLTRDGRMVERKKYGFKKARRSFQFSKR